MRVIWVWMVALTLLFTVTLGWYLLLPVSFALSSSIEEQISVNPALNTLRIIEFVSIVWGPFWDILIVLWAWMQSQRIDPTSIQYG